jgi:hypothetical protein
MPLRFGKKKWRPDARAFLGLFSIEAFELLIVLQRILAYDETRRPYNMELGNNKNLFVVTSCGV